MKSIRWRIGLSVFVTVSGLHIALSFYVLNRGWSDYIEEIDDDLMEELLELAQPREVAALVEFVRSGTENNTKWDEDFYEVRNAEDRLLAASSNVPAAGFRAPRGSARLRARQRGSPELQARVWEVPHPRSRSGHTRIRLAEGTLPDGSRAVVGESLKTRQHNYWRMREKLAWSLGGVALLVALVAWWVARRSLAPIHALSVRARQLGAAPTGLLPRSGRGDELDRLSEVLNEMLERIRAEVQRVRRLSADAAHALRTPLTAIRGNLDVYLASRAESELRELAPTLDVLSDTTRLVNGLLLLERLESGAPDPQQFAVVQLDALAAEVVETLLPVARERGLELRCAAGPAPVRGDLHQLRDALFNLLDNALRHTPEGGLIQVSVVADGLHARLSVEDSGPGLREDRLERVFERFYSDQAGRAGSGLGLPIARAIAQAHGGTLVALRAAASATGARFELELPLAASPAASA